MKMRNTLICDLDGTLALDNHRRPLIKSHGWAEYFKACVDDELNKPVAAFLDMWKDAKRANPCHKIVILTGRCETQRKATELWLDKHDVLFDELLMRPEDSYDPHGTASDGTGGHWVKDEDVKLAMIEQLGLTPERVFCCLDDRDCMVRFWREKGYDCWQVHPGDF